MRLFELAVAAALCWACTLSACTPSTPAQEPTPPPPAVPADWAANSGGGSSGSGGGGSSGGLDSIGGASNVHEKMCGGIAAIRCPEKQYCVYAPEARCGAADMSGTCAPVPDECTPLVDEVCGCDDKTYGSSCQAARAGVSVAMKGACAIDSAGTTAEGGLCGTRGAARDCAPGLYCAYRPGCGATDAGGSCRKKPTICTKIYKPVCGCDGKTYGNGCEAAAAGVSVAREGACKS